jgi:hypothetical protein
MFSNEVRNIQISKNKKSAHEGHHIVGYFFFSITTWIMQEKFWNPFKDIPKYDLKIFEAILNGSTIYPLLN